MIYHLPFKFLFKGGSFDILQDVSENNRLLAAFFRTMRVAGLILGFHPALPE
jgi:hypothetical protein